MWGQYGRIQKNVEWNVYEKITCYIGYRWMAKKISEEKSVRLRFKFNWIEPSFDSFLSLMNFISVIIWENEWNRKDK